MMEGTKSGSVEYSQGKDIERITTGNASKFTFASFSFRERKVTKPDIDAMLLVGVLTARN